MSTLNTICIDLRGTSTSSKKISSDSGNKSNNGTDLTGFVEISTPYLKFFKGSWVKYRDTHTGNYFSGGFLTDLTDDHAVLRNVQQKVIHVEKCHVFYCKNNTEIYFGVQELIIEKQKLTQEKHVFNQAKNQFNQTKKKIFQL
jgi:hypothetical protein